MNAKDENGRTLLMWAVINDLKDVFDILMEAGADFFEVYNNESARTSKL